MKYILFILVIICILQCQCHTPLQTVVAANQKFTINLYQELIKSQQGNIIFSGLSAEIILSLLAEGAKGTTQTELLTALGISGHQSIREEAFKELTLSLNINTDSLKLLSANKLFPANGFSISKEFKNTAKNVYHSDVQNLNYNNAITAAKTINDWVAEQTNNKITDLIDASLLNTNTVLVLVNALYFSGQWAHSFDNPNVKLAFYSTGSSSKEIDAMYTETTTKYKHAKDLQAKILELDFNDGAISIVFILPDEKTGLEAVESNLAKYLEVKDLVSTSVAITLPKFTINTEINLVPILQQLKVTTVFSSHADLSGITGSSHSSSLQVSFVVQKAYIKLTEFGVEAAAATGVSITRKLSLEPDEIFCADHPFFYYLRDRNTGAILFAGRYQE